VTLLCTLQVEEAKDDTVTTTAVTTTAVTDAAVTDSDAAAAAIDSMIASDVRGVKRYCSTMIRLHHTTAALVFLARFHHCSVFSMLLQSHDAILLHYRT
jgi:hypothetical protein